MAHIGIVNSLRQLDLYGKDATAFNLNNHVDLVVAALSTHVKNGGAQFLGIHANRHHRKMFEESTEQCPFT